MDFLTELEQLRLRTPRLYNINIGSENSDYCTHSDKNKNCYLLFAANFNEDCFYGGILLNSKDCVDNDLCQYCELCYECVDIDHCYNCSYSQDLKNCTDCLFCYDCVGCKNCFGCAGLRQKQFYFFNELLSKEKYHEQIKEFLKTKEDFFRAQTKLNELELKIPHRADHNIQTENCIGDYIGKSRNCYLCFDTYECEDSFYLKDCYRTKDSADTIFSDGSELLYECFSIGFGAYNCNFCYYTRSCVDCEYCELCFNCKNCFGCVGLQNKEFHILNKAYTGEEYFKKVQEIKEQMKKDGTYGRKLPTTYRFEDSAAAVYDAVLI